MYHYIIEKDSKRRLMAAAVFSPEQQNVFDEYRKGKNIFMTGPGGVGKSYLIRKIHEDAVTRGKKISVCASTGCAAILLQCQATTLHSWAGIGIAADYNNAIANIKKYRKTTNWRNTELLIVDEVSMISLNLFDILFKLGQEIRDNELPFGGIQLIFSGDFFQLPPVPNGGVDTGQFCFESENWFNTFDVSIQLKTNFRQNDEEFARVLNDLRLGRLTEESSRLLRSRVDIQADHGDIKPIKLFPLKRMVDRLNEEELRKIEEPEHQFNVEVINDIGYHNIAIEREERQLKQNSRCEEELILKKGAQVMCIANIDLSAGICNGTVGIVTGFNDKGLPEVTFNNGARRLMGKYQWSSNKIQGIAVTQIPLILAWAVTIHKSQGATLDLMEIDVGQHIFERGQIYVGLSRVRDINGLFIKSFDPRKIKISRKVKQFYEMLG